MGIEVIAGGYNMLIGIIILVVFLIIKIIFSEKEVLPIKFIFTPLTTFSIICIPLLYMYSTGNTNKFLCLIVAGLILSLIGDIFNMLETGDNSNIRYGIVFFLLVHFTYIYAFFINYKFDNIQIIIALCLIAVIVLLLKIFSTKVKSIGLLAGITIYMIIVSTMLLCAIGNLWHGISVKSILIVIGALLFWMSDLLFGIHSFYKKVPLQYLFVWGLYAPAQLLIALSCLY